VARLRWRRSSYSVGNPEQCVEAALTTNAVFLRDSKDSTGPTLVLSPDGFGAFLRSVRSSHPES
jgi:hypothetical protein